MIRFVRKRSRQILAIVAALVTVGSLLIFLALCYWLHVRDKELMARREEFETAKA